MAGSEALVPMWILNSGNRVFDSMPPRPVLVDVETLGTTMHGQIVFLEVFGARVLPDVPFLLWTNVRVSIRFRFADVVYTLSGLTTESHSDHSFSFDFDSVTRERMAVLEGQLKEGGYLQEATTQGTPPPEEEEEEEEQEEESPPSEDDMLKVRHLVPPPGAERRAHPRHDLMVDATVQKITTSRILRGQVLEISLGGCRVYTEFPNGYDEGDRIEVQFVGRGFPFRLSGRVQFQSGDHLVGVKFLHMSMRTSERLVQLIHELDEGNASPLEP